MTLRVLNSHITGVQLVGPVGPIGPTGKNFIIAKTYATVDLLLADNSPTGILVGEFAVIVSTTADPDNGRVYLWDGTQYTYMLDMSGIDGLVGPVGPAGPLTVANQQITNPTLTAYLENIITADTGIAYSLDCNSSNIFNLRLTSNCSFTFINLPANGSAYCMTIFLVQDTIGSRLPSFPAAVKWTAGVAPTFTTTASKVDVVTFTTLNGGSSWFGTVGGLNVGL
jgi:hypothetical protein